MKKRIMALSFALVLALTGCGKEESAASSGGAFNKETVTTNRQSGSDISLYMRPPSTLNPLENDDETVDMVLRLVYEPLIGIDNDFKPYGNLAEGWYFSNEGKTITIKLKKGLRWHSGSAITADDVAYSINTIKNAKESSIYKSCVKYIEDVTMIDSLTVNIDFKRAFYGNIYALTFPLISHRAGSGQNVYEGASSMTKLGNGSFDFGSYTVSKSLELVKDKSCIGKDAVAERINVVISKDKDNDLYYFTTGVTDCIYGKATDFVGKTLPARAAEYSFSTGEYDFIGFNFNNPVLNNKSVRKAVAYCVPKDEMLKVIYLSNATLTDSPINPSSWLYEKDVVKYDYNINEAKRVLEENGWIGDVSTTAMYKDTEEGRLTLSLSILVNKENEQRRQVAKRMADELMAAGFSIEVKELSFEEYAEAISNGNYDMVIGGWSLSYDNDLKVLFGNYGNNIIRYNDETMNGYLEAINEAVGEGNVKSAYSDIQKYISEELPYISLTFKKGKLYTGDNIEGGNDVIGGWVFGGVYNWIKR